MTNQICRAGAIKSAPGWNATYGRVAESDADFATVKIINDCGSVSESRIPIGLMGL